MSDLGSVFSKPVSGTKTLQGPLENRQTTGTADVEGLVEMICVYANRLRHSIAVFRRALNLQTYKMFSQRDIKYQLEKVSPRVF